MKNPPKQTWPTHLMRIARTDLPAGVVLANARDRGDLVVQVVEGAIPDDPDYAQLDAGLTIDRKLGEDPSAVPTPGLGYAGFTVDQRGAFLAWLEEPTAPAPPAFQQLYLANLEVRLLEPVPCPQLARERLLALSGVPTWAGQPGLSRSILLAFWLAQDGTGLARWLAKTSIPGELVATALGLQALLGAPLLVEQLPGVLAGWALQPANLPAAILALRLSSLTAHLGQEPLAYVLAKVGDDARTPLPWRCQHRDLRVAFPQPRLRPLLEPLLADMLTYSTQLPAAVAPEAEEGSVPSSASDVELNRAHLIIEFGHSRSEVFAYALRQAQKQAGFMQIMDETRHVIYRVPFRRNETRRFWTLWESVQNWSSSRIYCEGRELEKWQVYPYSQYMR